MAELAIVIPTIAGREDYLARCLDAYEATTPVAYAKAVVFGETSCGIAWNRGIRETLASHPDVLFVHLTADDIEPHPGWYEAAVESIGRGEFPAPRILNTDGSLQSCGDADELPDGTEVETARIPFFQATVADALGPFIETHYYTDNWFSHRGRTIGIPSVVNRRYEFTHHLAVEGRGDADRRMRRELRDYQRATRRRRRG